MILHEAVLGALSKIETLPRWIDEALPLPPPIYQDDEVRIYELAQWLNLLPLPNSGAYENIPPSAKLNILVGETFKLHGWKLHGEVDAHPCESVTIESWWELVAEDASTPPWSGHNTLELILSEADGDGQVAICKKEPANINTAYWKQDVFYRDFVELQIPCYIEDGEYLLLLGMIDSNTWESHRFHNSDGGHIGDLYYLTTLYVTKE